MDTTNIDMNGGEAAAAGMGMGVLIFQLIVALFYIIVFWKIFSKAGQPGWAAIVPIYNMIVTLQIAGKPVWWFILLFIPVVNIVIAIMVAIALAKSFGKGGGFAAGLILLSFIFFPILAFGSAQYVGPGDAQAPAAPQAQ